MDAITISKTSMADSVRALYDTAHKVISVHARLNALAMSAMQSLGYNGFKRWHRCRAKELFALDIELANEFIDRFRIKGDFKEYELSYSPSGMEEHLKAWESALMDGIQELGKAGKDYYELSGMEGCAIKKALEILAKDYRKAGRLLRRFNESDWLSLDMHSVDDKLHKKYKKMEAGDGCR